MSMSYCDILALEARKAQSHTLIYIGHVHKLRSTINAHSRRNTGQRAKVRPNLFVLMKIKQDQ